MKDYEIPSDLLKYTGDESAPLETKLEQVTPNSNPSPNPNPNPNPSPSPNPNPTGDEGAPLETKLEQELLTLAVTLTLT